MDSVDDAVEATVDAVDEVAEEATVDEATVDETGAVDYFVDHLNYETKDGDETLTSTITYAADPKNKKDTTANVATIKGVDSPVSWANIVRVEDWDGADLEGAPLGYEAGYLIETVLTGSEGDDTSLVNDKKVTISPNRYTTDAENQAFWNKTVNGFRSYDVIDLGSDNYLFVGYGSIADDGSNDNWNQEKVKGDATKLIPVFEYDGRQIEFAKSDAERTAKGKREVLDVDAALVKYDSATATLTEIPGVTVTAKVDKKNAKNATVSGERIREAFEYKYKDGDQDKTLKSEDIVVSPISGATNPTFTIKVKATGEAKDQAKVIKEKTKEYKREFAIRQRVVDIDVDSITDVNSGWKKLFQNGNDPTEPAPVLGTSGVSANNAFASVGLLADDIDGEDLTFEGFTLSKFDQAKGKANLVLNVDTFNGKAHKDATISLKAGTDYELTDGTLAGEAVKVLDFKGNYIYRDASTANLAGNGYKWAFRQTPSTDSKKKAKTFRYGVFKDGTNGFVFNADETAVVPVEEEF